MQDIRDLAQKIINEFKLDNTTSNLVYLEDILYDAYNLGIQDAENFNDIVRARSGNETS